MHAIVYQCGYDATDHPRPGEHAHSQENDQGDGHIADGLDDALFESLPRNPIDRHRNGYADSSAHEESHLTATTQGVTTEEINDCAQHHDEDKNRNYCYERMR